MYLIEGENAHLERRDKYTFEKSPTEKSRKEGVTQNISQINPVKKAKFLHQK